MPTTIRFSAPVYRRLDASATQTGLPLNSIVVVACLDWLDAHEAAPSSQVIREGEVVIRPRAATLGRIARTISGKKLEKRPEGYSFERFNDEAKALLTRAQKEAEDAKLPYIGTEHLLLALTLDTTSIGGRALANLGVDRKGAMEWIMARLGKMEPSTKALPTSRVKTVIEIAFQQAVLMSAHQVGTEHFLLGLVLEGEGIAAGVLQEYGVDAEKAQAEVERLLAEEAAETAREIELRPTLQVASGEELALLWNWAAEEALSRAAEEVTAEHVVLALLNRDPKRTAAILRKAGFKKEKPAAPTRSKRRPARPAEG